MSVVYKCNIIVVVKINAHLLIEGIGVGHHSIMLRLQQGHQPRLVFFPGRVGRAVRNEALVSAFTTATATKGGAAGAGT